MPEFEVRAACRERQLERERVAEEEVMCSRRSRVCAPVDPDDQLLATVLRHKNAKALQIAIEQSEHEAVENVAVKANATQIMKEQACMVLVSLIRRCLPRRPAGYGLGRGPSED